MPPQRPQWPRVASTSGRTPLWRLLGHARDHQHGIDKPREQGGSSDDGENNDEGSFHSYLSATRLDGGRNHHDAIRALMERTGARYEPAPSAADACATMAPEKLMNMPA